MNDLLVVLVPIAVAVSFAVSASAGFGGSLILVPTLALLLGTKEGVALAALLLAANNVVKVCAYRDTLPFRRAAPVVLLSTVGASIGAAALVVVPDTVVTVAVLTSFAGAFVVERLGIKQLRSVGAPVLAFFSGATSGFTGTSGPLKGLAVRSLDFDRQHLVGALSLVSLVGDITKTAIWTDAGLVTSGGYVQALIAVPVMVAATVFGRKLNRAVGEQGYAGLFWTVMAGYAARLVSAL